MAKKTAAALLAGIISIAFSSSSLAQLIGVSGGAGGGGTDPGAVLQVDPTDGSVTVIGTPYNGVGLSGIAQAADGTVYAVTSVSNDDLSHLITIDPSTGSLISDLGGLLDASGNGCGINDIEFHPSTGVLYAMASNQSSVGVSRCGLGGIGTGGYLLTIDITTVNYTVLGRDASIGNNTGGIAFDSSGTLYFTPAWSNTGNLHTLDLTDGSFTSSVALSDTVGFQGLAIDQLSGTMYGTMPSNGTRNFYTIDPASGTLTIVGSQGTINVHDVLGSTAPAAPATPVPALPLWALWVLAGVTGLFGAKRLRKAA